MLKRFLTALAVLATLLLLPTLGMAQSQDPSSGLQISPTRSELTISPTKSDTITLSVKNITSGEIVAKAEIDDFTADNETGTPQLITSGGQVPTTSVRPFLGTIADIPLKPGETKKITITLKVPAEQPAGGYYGVLRFKAFPANTANDTNGQRVSLTASVGHIILVQVPGQITEKLDALSLRAEYHKNPSNFFIHPPDGMRLEVKNIGNSFIKPFGTVSVKDGKGKEIYSYEINATDPRGNVLPKSTRAFHDNIKNIGKFGHYSAVASVTYGNGGDVLGLKTSFWVVPLWVMIVAGAVVLVAAISIALLVRLWRKHRRNLHTRH